MLLNNLFKILSDESRIRLVLLLQQQELTVAELSEITRLAQPRVSTHLAHLKKHNLVKVRKQGVSSYYRLNDDQFDQSFSDLLEIVQKSYAENPLVIQDKLEMAKVMSDQAASNQWVDAVAGDMERHYSPGRTWEATTRVISKLVNLGQVLDLGSGDGVLAELMAKNAQNYTCLDNNAKAIDAAKARLSHLDNIEFKQSDIHELPFKNDSFDCVLMLHVLTYSIDPEKVIKQAFNVLKPGGRLLISTLNKHNNNSVLDEYGHKNLGFKPDQLFKWCNSIGFNHVESIISSQEQRKPHFKIITVETFK